MNDKDNAILRFLHNFSWLSAFNGLSYLFSFLIYPVLLQKFGVFSVGKILTAQSLVLTISFFASYSLSFYIPYHTKKISEDREELGNILKLSFQVRLLISIFMAFFSVVIVYFFYRNYLSLWLCSLVLLLPRVINFNLFFNSLEKNKWNTVLNFFSKLICLVMLYANTSLLWVNPIIALSEFIVTLLYLKYWLQPFLQFKWSLPLGKVLRFIYDTRHMFYLNLFSFVRPQMLYPFIEIVMGSSYVTYYALADKVINMARSLPGNTFISIYSIYAKKEINLLSVKKNFALLCLSILFSLTIFYFSDDIIYLANNKKSLPESSMILKILTISLPVSFLIVPVFSYIMKRGLWNLLVKIAATQLAVQVAVILLFGYTNIYTIACSVIVAEILSYLLYLYAAMGIAKKESTLLKRDNKII